MSTREERKARKQERMERDKQSKGIATGSYALTKGDHEFEFYKPESDTWCSIDVIPYLIATKNHPEVHADRMDIGDEDYFLEYWVHSRIGPGGDKSVICRERMYGEACPVCEYRKELEKQGATDDEIRALYARHRVAYNVINLDDRKKGIQVFEVSFSLFHKELKSKLNRNPEGWFDFSDIEDGKTIRFYSESTSGGGFKYNSYKDFSFEDRKRQYSENDIERAIPLDDLLFVPTYDEAKSLFEGRTVVRDDASDSDGSSDDASDASDDYDDEVSDDSVKEEPKAERKVEEKKKKSSSGCPYGHVFGEDNGKTDDCTECDDDTWDACNKKKKGG
jgi:hypothetical protein